MTPRQKTIGSKRVTIIDVAQRAGVDPSVVSRVINNDDRLRIKADTRERVVAAVRALDYRPNAAARTLRTAKVGAIGLFIPDFANPVYSEIIAGAEAAASLAGCVLVTGTDEVVGRSEQTYLDLLGSGRVDGVLLAGGSLKKSEQARFEAAAMPYLFVNRRDRDGSRYVVLDDNRAAQVAVRHLLDLGHRSIAMIGGPSGTDTARRRRQGYLAAMKKSGEGAESLLMASADYTPSGGFAAFNEIAESSARPTAVFVANFALAIGALKAAERRGIRIPEDLSVVAVHDLALAEYLYPALTTVQMPLRELGARAVELLMAHGRTDQIQDTVREPMRLVERESTAAPR